MPWFRELGQSGTICSNEEKLKNAEKFLRGLVQSWSSYQTIRRQLS